jgi:glycosyltransferase involved in cell wall biosynthesis
MSAEDAARLRRFHPGLRVSVSPLGIDCTYFAPREPDGAGAAGPAHTGAVTTAQVAPVAPVAPDVDLVFVGNFEHPPNVDAATFLIDEILPRLGRPVRVRIIGRAIPPGVAALARAGVEVLGPVPDVRPHLAAARVVVAPVRFGTGMRGKILEALAMARAVVTTAVGAEGLGATDGVHLLVATDAVEFAAAIRSVLDDPKRGERLGVEGRALVAARFDWDAVATVHEGIYEEVLRDPGPTPAWRPDPVASWGPRAGRLGREPALAAGFAVLLWRGLRWHLRSALRHGGAAASAPSSRVAGTTGRISAGVSRP